MSRFLSTSAVQIVNFLHSNADYFTLANQCAFISPVYLPNFSDTCLANKLYYVWENSMDLLSCLIFFQT